MCLPSWLAFVCVFTSGEWTSQKAERLKPLFNSQACLWVFGFQGGKCQETQTWKEAAEFGMCWYFSS